MSRLIQSLTGTTRYAVLNTVKRRPGVFRKMNWNTPVASFVGCVSRAGVATTLAGSNNSVVGPVSLVLDPPATRTLPVESRAAKWSRRPLTSGKVGDHFAMAGSYNSAVVGKTPPK